MNADLLARTLVLTGPTGSGKSDLALDLARRYDAEIVAMDSMTLYRGMDIGTAKPSADDRRAIRHHLIDVLDPWESASVSWWLGETHRVSADIVSRGRRVLIVGGTPLYLKALLYGLFDGPPADRTLRTQLEDEANCVGDESLHKRLREVDPISAERLHPHDRRRIVRALEVWQLTGRSMSDWQQEWKSEPEPLKCVCIDMPREELYARIDARVGGMIQAGLVDEVRGLMTLPQPLSREAGQAAGYQEIMAHLRGEIDLDMAIREIQTRTRNLAKRQLTWFRQLSQCERRPRAEIAKTHYFGE